jgi:hypothetical protein
MSLGEVAQLITAIALAANVYQSWRNGQGIERVHKATNSMKDQLIASTDKESFARGVKAGETSSMNLKNGIS